MTRCLLGIRAWLSPLGHPLLSRMNPEIRSRFPDKRDVAARAELAALPPAPLERGLDHAASSPKFISEGRAKALPDLPETLRPFPFK